MPRFPEESVACLKRTLLACASQEFRFSTNDVGVICRETGLNQAQVQVWAENFRMRFVTLKERMDFLKSDGFDKEYSCKVTRIFVACFNVTLEFAANFKFQKSKGQGEFGIKYMLVSFNELAGSGEFFIEFDEYVWSHKLIESFKSQGACQISTTTFANNDGGESAVNALARISAFQDKSGVGYNRGTCNPALLAKLHAKMEEASRQEQLDAKEFDEKTSAAIKQSLEANTAKLEAIGNDMQSQAVKLEAIEGGVHSQAVELVDIRQGVCNVIPDYQNEIRNLKEALAHKTKLCDRIEAQKGRLTMEINKLKWELGEKTDENESLTRDKLLSGKKIQDLQMQLDVCQSVVLLKQMQEETQRTAEILAATLAEERAFKRPRA